MKRHTPQPAQTSPRYANWVSSRFVYLPAAMTAAFGGLAFLSPWIGLPGLLSLASGVYFAHARRQFSSTGGDVQSRVQGLVLEELRWDGRGDVLDIGCSNGPLTIAIAKRYPEARVTGIDTWGSSWEYSQAVCERNATIDGVSGRTSFHQASAAALPFPDAAFDAVVINLVFHEVRSVKDKKVLLAEALRVLRPG